MTENPGESGGLPESAASTENDQRQHGLYDLPNLTDGLEVRFPPGMPLPIQRLMATLGVRVRFDASLSDTYAAAGK